MKRDYPDYDCKQKELGQTTMRKKLAQRVFTKAQKDYNKTNEMYNKVIEEARSMILENSVYCELFDLGLYDDADIENIAKEYAKDTFRYPQSYMHTQKTLIEEYIAPLEPLDAVLEDTQAIDLSGDKSPA